MSAPLNILAITVTQERVPLEMRGRVFGAGRACALAAYPLTALATGALIEAIDVRGTIVVIAVAHLALACVLVRQPVLRGLTREGG